MSIPIIEQWLLMSGDGHAELYRQYGILYNPTYTGAAEVIETLSARGYSIEFEQPPNSAPGSARVALPGEGRAWGVQAQDGAISALYLAAIRALDAG